MTVTLSKQDLDRPTAQVVTPESFHPEQHFYPRTLNAQIHPLVAFFMRLSKLRIVERYCHLNPQVDRDALTELLSTKTKVLHWAGCDLFYAATGSGVRRMIVVETNSCPSGNKSMPLLNEEDEQGGYRRLLAHAFVPRVRAKNDKGQLAVIYDKNYIEASGYAAAMADLFKEEVLLAPFAADAEDPPVRVVDRAVEVRGPDGAFVPIRGALRYVTQKPWNRLPPTSKTVLLNPVMACLAGGRNKLMASKAYELFNAEIKAAGLVIRQPETIRDVTIDEVPLWVARFGGQAVVKNPYSNAGQGVWTITCDEDLEEFSEAEHSYGQFIVQALIGNAEWSSRQEGSRFYHVGTMPDKKGRMFAADLRMMVCSGPDGFVPLSVYARRAKAPLARSLDGGASSWDMLGTNLSEKNLDGSWSADTERLLLMDRRDFNRLGLGPDDLLEAYVQTVLSVVAIDRLARKLLNQKGGLKKRLFRSLNDDDALVNEVQRGLGEDATAP